MRSVRLISVVAAVLGAIVATVPAIAELPPQFTTWADFAAVVGQSSIPYALGTVDRIERTPNGKYIVHAGVCFVEVTVTRAPAVSPDGKVMPGPSHIVRVDVGPKQCDK